MASKAQLCKYRMIININKKSCQLPKLQYLQINDDDLIVKHSLQMSIIELYNNGQNSFIHI